MTHSAPVLTDALLRQALRELASSPDGSALTSDVLTTVAATRQVGGSPWPRFSDTPRVATLGLAALLLIALAASLVLLAGLLPRPLPTPFSPSTIVVQSGGPIWGTADVTHVAFAPGATAGAAFHQLPPMAAEPRWSPDGTRVAYLLWASPSNPADPYMIPEIGGLYVANGDGSAPLEAELPELVRPYGLGGSWHTGAKWAPSGDWFHLSFWAGHQVYDVYDATAEYLWRLDLDPLSWGGAVWSPDGSSIGWIGATCADGSCDTRAFNWKPVSGDGEVRSTAIQPVPDDRALFTVTWARDNRLVFVEHRAIGGKLGYQGWTGSDFSHVVVRSYSTALDGTDVREVAAPNDGQLEQVPSPDGRRLAAWDSEAEAVVITDIETGEITEIPVPGAFMIAEWSPAGDRLALAGPTESTEAPWAFFVLNADGTGLQSLGLGTGFAWMPAATADPED